MIKSQSTGDKVFDWVNVILCTAIALTVIYPLYMIIISSISEPDAVLAGEVLLHPVGTTFEGYQRIFADAALWRGYRNSIFYTVLDTSFAVSLTLMGAYALSRKDLYFRNTIMFAIVFTMFFQGGLIPTYLLVRDLGMLDTIWALFVPSAVTVFHIIIVRTFFQSTIPDELLEAAQMDGCSDFRFLFRIVLPLSLPIIAVMILFNAVQQWNAFFPALIYLSDRELYPLQLILRDILIKNAPSGGMMEDEALYEEEQRVAALVKYGVIIVASLPVIIMYPFLQKYFVKGVMIGSIKG